MSNSIYQSYKKRTQRWKFNLRMFWKLYYTSWVSGSLKDELYEKSHSFFNNVSTVFKSAVCKSSTECFLELECRDLIFGLKIT